LRRLGRRPRAALDPGAGRIGQRQRHHGQARLPGTGTGRGDRHPPRQGLVRGRKRQHRTRAAAAEAGRAPARRGRHRPPARPVQRRTPRPPARHLSAGETAMSQTQHLHMRGVRKSFRFFGLHDLDLELEPGQVMGLVGPNGAGKSTTLRLVMGMLAPDAGQIHLFGHPMPEAQAEAKQHAGFVSADMRLLPNATLGWHLRLLSSIYPDWDAAYASVLLKRFNLHPEQMARSLSLGEQTKAALLLALARRPRLLVLDEPTTGLDP